MYGFVFSLLFQGETGKKKSAKRNLETKSGKRRHSEYFLIKEIK